MKTKLIFFFCVLVMTACSVDICGNTLIKHITSPKKNYVASIFERNCGATTPFIRVVSLRHYESNFDPENQENWVFSIEGQPEVEVIWLNDGELKINYSAGIEPIETTKWNDVKILY